jgi:hypothetical protein
MAPGAACNATYELQVRPLATGTHTLTAQTISGTTATMLDETGAPFVYGPLCQLAIETGTNYTSVPVNLSRIESTPGANDTVQLRFETISETGSLYFRVVDADDDTRTLADRIASKALGDHQPTWYEHSITAPVQGRFYIDQHEIGERVLRFGPFSVGAVEGERLQRTTIDWPAVAREQAEYQAQRGQPTSAAAQLSVDESGLYRVRFEDLQNAGIDLGGVPMNELALTLDRQPVPRGVSSNGIFGPGAYIEFLAEIENQPYYGRRLTYRLEHDAAGARDWPVSHLRADPALAADRQARTVSLADNREYASGSVLADPWYLRRLVRNNSSPTSISETLQLSDVDSNQGATLRLEAWGGLDYPDADPDHAFSLSLNGSVLGSTVFDGLNPLVQSFDIPAGLLLEGANSVTLSLTSTAYATDRINIEAIHIDYHGSTRAQADQWELNQPRNEGEVAALSDRLFDQDFENQPSPNCIVPSCRAIRVSGLTGEPRVFRLGASGAEQLLGAHAQGDDWLLAVPGAGRYRAFGDTATLRTPLISSSATAPITPAPADFLIIADESFVSALSPLVSARQSEGLSTRVISTQQIYAQQRSARPTADAIADYLREIASTSGLRYVLLVGSDSYDYDNNLGLGSISFVPGFYRQTHPLVRHTPTDLPFADLDGDGTPELAVGRWPVRTQAELQHLLDKTLLRSSNSNSEGALLIADRLSSDYSFAEQNQQMSVGVAFGGPRSLLDLDDFAAGSGGTALARDQLQASVNSGQRWLNYFGHASPYQWASSSLLSSSQVAGGLFSNSTTPFVLTQWGCWGAYHVLPEHNSLVHSLLLQSGGAVAAIGASALAETGPSTSLATRMLKRLDSEARLGDAWRNALREHVLDNPAAVDVNMGTLLLGDPTLPLD